MTKIKIELSKPRPFFAEIPYYLWGQANYDSDGNCAQPTDQLWTELSLENRDTEERLTINEVDKGWSVEGEELLVSRACAFLLERSAEGAFALCTSVDRESHLAGMKRAEAVAREFQHPELKPFDSDLFWGSWKWIGWFASDFTWTGRWIMHAIVRKDTRAVSLCIAWLKQGTYAPGQSTALRYALRQLTGSSFETDRAWIKWYDGGLVSRGSRQQFPKPNLEDWLKDLKIQTAEMLGGSPGINSVM